MATITSTISNVVFSSYDSVLGAYRRVDFTWVLAGATSSAMTSLTDMTTNTEIDLPSVSSPRTGTFTLDYSNMTPTSWDSYAFVPGHTVTFSDIASGYWDGSDTVTGDSSLGVVPAAPGPSGAPKLYGPVNGLSKQIKTLYGSVNGQSKELTKLYGSVNGVSKLIYEKITGPAYGVVYYKPSSSSSTVLSVELQSQAEFDSLCRESGSWTASIGGGTVTVSNRGTNIIFGIDIGKQITTIGNHFLRNCIGFNRTLVLPSRITSIGTDFLYGCNAMVSTVNVGNLSDTIIPSSWSNYSFSTSNNTAACYTTGITIAGANRAAWLSRFSNRTSDPYRKLLDAGH